MLGALGGRGELSNNLVVFGDVDVFVGGLVEVSAEVLLKFGGGDGGHNFLSFEDNYRQIVRLCQGNRTKLASDTPDGEAVALSAAVRGIEERGVEAQVVGVP